MYVLYWGKQSNQSRGLELYRHYAVTYTRSRCDRRFECHFSLFSMVKPPFHLQVQHFFVFFNPPHPANSLDLASSFRPMSLHEQSDPSDSSVCSIVLPCSSFRFSVWSTLASCRRSSSTPGTNHFYSKEPKRNPRKKRVRIIQQIKLKNEIRKRKYFSPWPSDLIDRLQVAM